MSEEIIGYTVKEILIRLDSKLDVIDAKLETKADRLRVHDLANVVAGVDKKVEVLDKITVKKDGAEMERLREAEESISESSGVQSYKRFIWPAVALTLGGLSWLPTLLAQKP